MSPRETWVLQHAKTWYRHLHGNLTTPSRRAFGGRRTKTSETKSVRLALTPQRLAQRQRTADTLPTEIFWKLSPQILLKTAP